MGNENTKEKPFLTYEEMVDKLKNEKHLEVPDEKHLIGLLKEHSYFALVSGYKELFKTKDKNYKPYTTINDIYALYVFDDRLRVLFLQYILKIEKHIKSLMSYSFCEAYGEEQKQYLNVNNYNYIPERQEDINKLVARLADVIENPKNFSYIKHQKRAYGNIPLWVMMKALTLGTVSKMYSLLTQDIQQKISKEFEYVNEGMLIQMLDLLARVRNICAHNERLFDYKYKKGTIDDTEMHYALGIHRKNGRFVKGKNDLFAVVIILKYLLKKEEFDDFIEELTSIFNELYKSTRIIQKPQMLKYMGFPEKWQDIKEL